MHMDSPTISLVIPCYNEEGNLRELIKTIRDAVDRLKLSESTALNFINVARKAVQVPALQAEIRAGHVSVSKARKIVPVLTPQNQDVVRTIIDVMASPHKDAAEGMAAGLPEAGAVRGTATRGMRTSCSASRSRPCARRPAGSGTPPCTSPRNRSIRWAWPGWSASSCSFRT